MPSAADGEVSSTNKVDQGEESGDSDTDEDVEQPVHRGDEGTVR